MDWLQLSWKPKVVRRNKSNFSTKSIKSVLITKVFVIIEILILCKLRIMN